MPEIDPNESIIIHSQKDHREHQEYLNGKFAEISGNIKTLSDAIIRMDEALTEKQDKMKESLSHDFDIAIRSVTTDSDIEFAKHRKKIKRIYWLIGGVFIIEIIQIIIHYVH